MQIIKDSFLLCHGQLQVVSPWNESNETTDLRKQDFDTKYCYLFSMDVKKGCLILCDEEASQSKAHIKKKIYYLKHVVPFDVPTFYQSNGT